MKSLKRYLVGIGVGLALLIGLTNCVVTPVAPAPRGYVVVPPPVIIRPYRPYRPHYHPHRRYYPYPKYYPYRYRW